MFSQRFQDFEIVVVDNESKDKTLEKIRQFSVEKIVTINDYLPGKALNKGIEKAVGKYFVLLSVHCIPTGSQWLEIMIKAIEEDIKYAEVYGRQEPMSFTSPAQTDATLCLFLGLIGRFSVRIVFFTMQTLLSGRFAGRLFLLTIKLPISKIASFLKNCGDMPSM